MTATLYGLKNCDSCREARRWLAAQDIGHDFVDLRERPIERERLSAWLAAEGWQTLLNRRSRTWRELPQAERDGLDADAALALMQRYPTLIKRPVLELATGIVVGFSTPRYQAAVAGRG